MNKEVAKKWVNALRSGKYKKGVGQLYNTHTKEHCCLGVLCEVVGVAPFSDKDIGLVPKIVCELAGLTKTQSMGPEDLATFNDDRQDPYSFDEIADIIQMTWKEL